MSSKPIEVNGDSSMEPEAKEHCSQSQIEAVERASRRVGAWPEWKRSAVSYRASSGNSSGTSDGSKSSAKAPSEGQK
jgi:hypothetical protein